MVLLKPLSQALEDGDCIHAVIRSVATNNDGAGKVSFTAPSVNGQIAVISAAHREAGVDPSDISYVEAHGTATSMGDPVEMEGLTSAFRIATTDKAFCRIGSVKSNIGHTVATAGVAGLIKTALALENGIIPASIHFSTPNSRIDFAASPFVVNTTNTNWPRTARSRIAGLSSFGVGGTNAHAVIEEAPERLPSSPAIGAQLLMLSARSRPALNTMAHRFAEHLRTNPGCNLADVTFTLQTGRSRFSHRLAVVAEDVASAGQVLASASHPQRISGAVGAAIPGTVWVFPGQGAQYAGMGRELHHTSSAFRTAFEECLAAFGDGLQFDLKRALFSDDADALIQTAVTQPATFCIEYALGRMWLADGLEPVAMIGHSIGEFAAAVLAGAMELSDAARLIALRGALMQAAPAGSMLQIRLPVEQVESRLPAGLSLAANNSPRACVVAGPTSQIDEFGEQLEREGAMAKKLFTSHAFHSTMMESVVEPFRQAAYGLKPNPPRYPIFSTLTGCRLAPGEGFDADYWARHLRNPVRFSEAVQQAMDLGNVVFLEVGPRGSLSGLIRQHKLANGDAPFAVASLGAEPGTERASTLLAQGQLWTTGIEPGAVYLPRQGRQRVLLPTYPFERKRYLIDPPIADASAAPAITRPPPVMPKPEPAHKAEAEAEAENAAYVAPSTETESLLAPMWGALLNIDRVSVTDAFQNLGGDSITALRLMEQTRAYFGCMLSPDTLLQAPTIRELARVIDGEFTSLTTVFLPLRKASAQSPVVVLLPGAGGHVFSFQRFARALAFDVTVYGLRPFGVDGEDNLPSTFEEIAAKYIDGLLKIEPTGPYIIGGYSLGAGVALEIALQLQRMGKPVLGLVSFDQEAPGFPRPLGLVSRWRKHVSAIRASGWRSAGKYLRQLAQDARRTEAEIIKAEIDEIRDGWELVPGYAMDSVLPVIWKAKRRYVPREKLDAPIFLIRSVGSIYNMEKLGQRDSTCGWGDLTKHGVEVRVVEGDHFRLFREEQLCLSVADATSRALEAVVK